MPRNLLPPKMVTVTADTDGVAVSVGASDYLGLQNQGSVNVLVSFDGGDSYPGILYPNGGGFGFEADFRGKVVMVKAASDTAAVCVTTRVRD